MAGFRDLGAVGEKQFYFGVLEGGRFSGEQVRAFRAPFLCGLVVDDDTAHLVEDLFHGVVLGLGCRGIAILGPHASDISDRFNRRVLEAIDVFVGRNKPWIWSTPHEDLEGWFGAIAAADDGFTTYILQIDSDSVIHACRRMIAGLSSAGP